jgi:TolB protein
MIEEPDDTTKLVRRLRPAQRTEVWVADVGALSAELVYSTDTLLLEAPNWAPDDPALLLNGDGLLWRLDLEPAVQLKAVHIADLPPINNDHVVNPERELIYLSANDGHIYVAPIEGGTAKRVTHDSTRFHYLHGLSPDRATLAFVEVPRADLPAPGRLALVSSAAGATRYPEAGNSHLDGPRVFARRSVAVLQHRRVRQASRSRAACSDAGRGWPHGASCRVRDGQRAHRARHIWGVLCRGS